MFARPLSFLPLFALVLSAVAWSADALGQQPGGTAGAKQRPKSPVGGPVRRLAPGVETTIKPEKAKEETFSAYFPGEQPHHEVVEILRGGSPGLNWKPNDSPVTETLKWKAGQVTFRRKVWHLEFTFKPLRMMWVDMPQPSGKLARKLVWYMVYRVKNTGNHLQPEEVTAATAEDPRKWESTDQGFKRTFKIREVDSKVWFTPLFVLQSEEYHKAYVDRVMPLVVPLIQQREDPNRKLLNTVEISRSLIPLSKGDQDNSVWSVATWYDLDGRMDRFSIYVQGLTNAYRWKDRDQTVKPLLKPQLDVKYTKGLPLSTERMMLRKTLRMRFWRPGDRFDAHEDEIRFGASPVHDKGKLDYEWVWR